MTLTELKPWLAFGLLATLLLWETVAPFFLFPKGHARLAHGAKNMLLGITNGLMTSLVFAVLWWWVAEHSAQHGIGLLHWFSLPSAVKIVAALLLLDAWTYAWHRMSHRVEMLWRFHRVHHSDPQMDVTTASRFHIGEIMISSVLRLPLIWLLGISLEQLALYELLLIGWVQFQHANISLGTRADRVLNWLLVTPIMHKIHHSRWQPETDSNYSALLSVWDRIFRSFRTTQDAAKLRLGLDEFADPSSQTLPGLLKTPLVTKPQQKS